MKLLLAPHNDDEALFASYICLRHRPLVLVCFDGRRRRHYVPTEIREAETQAAMRILGCESRQLHIPCDPPDWPMLEAALAGYDPEHVWAPLPEADGHSHHNRVGELAARLWPGRCTWYATYTLGGGRTRIGDLVETEPGWPELKQQALDCYQSQQARSGTRPHFVRALQPEGRDEYVVAAEAVAA